MVITGSLPQGAANPRFESPPGTHGVEVGGYCDILYTNVPYKFIRTILYKRFLNVTKFIWDKLSKAAKFIEFFLFETEFIC